MDKIPAHVQPRLKSWSDWPLENRHGAGPVCVIVIATAVLAWHTMMLPERSPLLVVLIAVQIALFWLSYWIQPSWIPLVLILVLSMIGDCAFPQYSDYVMNAQLAALGLFSYWTDDICAGLTLVVLSAYQWIWLTFSSYAQSDTSTVVLFIALFAVVALIGSIARHLVERAYRQQQMMQAMRSGIRAMAMDLHDAVSGSLTTAELLLQQCEVEADIASAIADPMWKEHNRCIHAEIHNAEDSVKGIVDLLLAEFCWRNMGKAMRRRRSVNPFVQCLMHTTSRCLNRESRGVRLLSLGEKEPVCCANMICACSVGSSTRFTNVYDSRIRISTNCRSLLTMHMPRLC